VWLTSSTVFEARFGVALLPKGRRRSGPERAFDQRAGRGPLESRARARFDGRDHGCPTRRRPPTGGPRGGHATRSSTSHGGWLALMELRDPASSERI